MEKRSGRKESIGKSLTYRNKEGSDVVYGGLNDSGPIGSHASVIVPQLAELFEKDLVVYPCWRSRVVSLAGGRL